MSHHDTPEVTTQVVEKMRHLFIKIHEEESSDLPLDIADSIQYTPTEGYEMTYNDVTLSIDLPEDLVDGFLANEEKAVEYIDSCVYAIMCDFEDDISYDDDEDGE